jgi:hypothetical protein
MVADAQSRQLISDILKLASPGAASAKAAGMKVTAIAGYPVFLCWAMWVGAEANANGVNKAILCLPYLQNPNVALTKFSGNTSLETPLDMVASEIINPYNCKLGITPGLNIGKLAEGEYYHFLVALKPAGFSQNGNTTAYWEGSIKGFGTNPNEVYKDYFALYATTKNQWASHKKSIESRQIDDEEPDWPPDGGNHQ